MFYDLRKLLVMRTVKDHYNDTFYMFSVRLVKSFINIFSKLKLYPFLSKIPRSVLYTISQGVSHVIAGDEEYKTPIFETIDNLMGYYIDKKYPNRKQHVKDRILYHNFIWMNLIVFDVVLLLPFLNKYRRVKDYFEISGLKHLKDALKKGNGVLILSAHLDNYLFLFCIFALMGYKTNAIMEIPSFISIIDTLEGSGLNIIPSPQPHYKKLNKFAKSKIDEALNNNEIVVILQDFAHPHYTMIEFFNELAYTPVGVVSLALKHNTPIIPAFIESSKNETHYRVEIEPEHKLKIEGFKNKKETILYNSYIINKYLEKRIRDNFIYWMILPLYHIRKKSLSIIKDNGKLAINNIYESIEFYKTYLMKSYEINRNDERILEILVSVKEKIEVLKTEQLEKKKKFSLDNYRNK
ncbi:MAG: hypothetical protein GF329_08775 [Candidatus Lokiarchaeota archaeon]|nr:hypothetical protein [Candidatus Lokiarchaeota archaeon]